MLFLLAALLQEPVDRDVIAKIREEGFQRSQVMDLAGYMSDVLGPRLTGSPNLERAQRWAKGRMEQMGLANVVIEPVGEHGVSWANRYTSLHLLEPDYQPLIGYPLAFTPGTAGKVTGPAKIIRVGSPADLEKYRGTLKGAVALISPPYPIRPRFSGDAARYPSDSLAGLSRVTIAARFGIGQTTYAWDSTVHAYLPVGTDVSELGRGDQAMLAFLKQEGVAATIEAGPGGDGTVFVTGRPGNRQDRSLRAAQAVPPMIALAAEHYNRIYRILERGLPVTLELEVRNDLGAGSGTFANVIGEWRGTDLADQVVMVGGHYDSWASGTGATDNAAGSAVALEAIRILKAIGVTPRRTIRVALWSYEEGGVFGSRRYVERHFGTRESPKPEHAKLSGYFNMDEGTGRFRGIYLQGNERVRPIFEAWLAPFADLEATTISINNAFGTDIVGFDAAGLPGFAFIQDPMDYETRTHHSNMDVYDKLVPDDLRRNAVIMASFLYHAAMRAEMLPREDSR
jgi:hypothetical protein